jgi:NAD(P)-dependent dehydrogenase (short-subunit alcohol dehydrogenase family)
MPWEDKVVLVTGGSAGLGKALATAFARQRARVIIVARGFESLQNTAQHLRALGDDVLALPADLTEQAEVDVLIALAARRARPCWTQRRPNSGNCSRSTSWRPSAAPAPRRLCFWSRAATW